MEWIDLEWRWSHQSPAVNIANSKSCASFPSPWKSQLKAHIWRQNCQRYASRNDIPRWNQLGPRLESVSSTDCRPSVDILNANEFSGRDLELEWWQAFSVQLRSRRSSCLSWIIECRDVMIAVDHKNKRDKLLVNICIIYRQFIVDVFYFHPP